MKTHRDGFPWFSARRGPLAAMPMFRKMAASQDGRNDVRRNYPWRQNYPWRRNYHWRKNYPWRKPREAAVPVASAHPRSA